MCRLAALAIVAAAICAAAVPTVARAWVPGPLGQIAYASDESQPGDSGGYHIWVINPDGSGRQELTHGDDDYPSWSPNGSLIAFTRNEPGIGWRIWVMSNTGADQRPLTPPGTPGTDGDRGNVMPRFSPDGTRIAFVSRVFDPCCNQQVWVMDADGAHLHQITDLPETGIWALSWSPDSSHLLFWATDIIHPVSNLNAPDHIYEMTSEGGAIHQIAFDPRPLLFTDFEGLQVGGLDWAPTGIAVAVPFDGIHIASSVSDGSPPTPVTAGSGLLVGPTWSPDSPRIPKLAFSWSPSQRDLEGGGDDPYELYRTNPFEQITFDSTDHVNASWGPARTVFPVHIRSTLSMVSAFEQGSTVVRVVLGCGSSAGRSGCLDRLIASSSSGARSSGTYKGRAGRARVVVLHLSKRLRGSLGVGKKLLLTLRATVRGKITVVRQRAPVFALASIGGSCPVSRVQLGSSVTVSGVLHASQAGAHAAAAGARTRVGMVAALNSGLTLRATGKTDRRGRFTLTFTPTEPGSWTFQVTWNGDRTHASAQGAECGVLVSPPPPPPPPVPTALTVSCQPGTADVPADVTGSLTPSVSAAPIRLTYQREGAPGDTITDTVSTAADGSFADRPTPDAAGTWDAVATYAGDSTHQAATSPTCQFTVALQQTALILTCPGKSALGQPLGVSGGITPAVLGASITLTYTHQTQGPLLTFTSTITTDSAGNFSDASVTPTDPGEWDVSADFAGDAARSASSSQPCAIQVS
jgi:WD40-like Beta Propeller Repeat